MPERGEAPVGRAIWSGSISFGLVTVPIELYSAWRPGGVALRMLGPSGTPLVRQYVCPEDDEVLTGDDIERGYDVGDGEYVTVTDEELERVAPGRSRDIALERFVPRDDVDPAYFTRSYFLMPGGEQRKAYSVLAAAMEQSRRAAIARFVMRGKAYAVAIFADKGLLRAETLRFGDEVRTAKGVQLPEPETVDRETAARIAARVEELSEPGLNEGELRDEAAEDLAALARRKLQRGEDVVRVAEEAEARTEEEQGGAAVVDLMAVLKQRMKEAAQGRQAGGGRETRETQEIPRGATGTRTAARAGSRSRSTARTASAARRSGSVGRARSGKARRAG